jgi:peptidyl-prolyl cis-trans isomerase SurA
MKKTLLSALVILLSLLTQAQVKKAVGDKIVAIVGDQIILHSDIKNSMEDLKRAGQQMPPDADCYFLQQSVFTKLLVSEALKDSIVISDEELDLEFEKRLDAWRRSSNDEMDAQQIIELKRTTMDALREWKLAETKQWMILENIRITPAEIKEFYDHIPKDSLLVKSLHDIHVLNMKDDYERISQMALLRKQQIHLEKWFLAKISSYPIEIDDDFKKCELVR